MVGERDFRENFEKTFLESSFLLIFDSTSSKPVKHFQGSGFCVDGVVNGVGCIYREFQRKKMEEKNCTLMEI